VRLRKLERAVNKKVKVEGDSAKRIVAAEKKRLGKERKEQKAKGIADRKKLREAKTIGKKRSITVIGEVEDAGGGKKHMASIAEEV
jgi:uncharacterized protein with WD repeat